MRDFALHRRIKLLTPIVDVLSGHTIDRASSFITLEVVGSCNMTNRACSALIFNVILLRHNIFVGRFSCFTAAIPVLKEIRGRAYLAIHLIYVQLADQFLVIFPSYRLSAGFLFSSAGATISNPDFQCCKYW